MSKKELHSNGKRQKRGFANGAVNVRYASFLRNPRVFFSTSLRATMI